MKIILIVIFLQLIVAQLQQAEIDEKMSEAQSDRIYKQNRIVFIVKSFSIQIQNCSKTLKADNVAKDVARSLDSFDNLLKVLSTIDDFESYVNISTCGDINYKITMIDFDRQKLAGIITSIYANTSCISRQQAELQMAYNSNLKSLVYKSANEMKVSAIIKKVPAILSDYWDYVRILSRDAANLAYFDALLTVFKKNYCLCLKTVEFTGYNSTLESNVQVVENKLIAKQSMIVELSSKALTKVKSALTSSSSSQSPNLQLLQSTLTKFISISDYPKISWPKIQNCNDFWIRLRFLQFKQRQYIQILSSASLNQSLLANSQLRVNASASSSLLSSSQLQITRDAINSSLAVRSNYRDYISQLIYSIVKVSRMSGESLDTECSCDLPYSETTTNEMTTSTKKTTTSSKKLTTSTSTKPTTSTSTTTTIPMTSTSTTSTVLTTTTVTESTTTTLPTTTTTIPPCGTFAPFDTVNGLNDLQSKGFSAGTFVDGSFAYVGFGANDGYCPDQNPCPGRMCDVPGKAGGYFPCAGVIYKATGNFYLLNHPNLMWVTTNNTDMMTVPSPVNIPSPWVFFYGRLVQSNITYLGKVHAGNGRFDFYYGTATAEIKQVGSFEMLTCGGPATTTTTTTSTTTTLPPTTTTLPPCGTFAPFDTVNGLNEPKNFGVSAGTYKDGYSAYVGYGDNSGCGNQNPCPGYINDNPANPGGYFGCGGTTVIYKTTSNFYVLNHPNLMWVATNTTHMMTVTLPLRVVGGSYPFFFGRFVSNGITYTGKVHAGNGIFAFYYINGNTENMLTTGFDIITCGGPETTTSTTTTTTTTTLAPTTTTPPCGTFAPFDTVNGLNDLKTKGFSGGTFADGSIAYVGHGANGGGCGGQNPCPGRICDVPGNAGGYFGCGGLTYRTTGNFYLLNHPNLLWVLTNNVNLTAVVSPLKILTPVEFYYGRTVQSNVTYLGKVHSSFDFYYNTATAEIKQTGNFEILTCSGPATTTSTTTTTTTLPPTTTTTIPPCGTFASFDTVNGLNDLKTKGVAAGTFVDGSIAYVGQGANGAQNPCPGRMCDVSGKAGGYFGAGSIVYKTTGNFYLQNHPSLMWVATNTTHMMTIASPLIVPAPYVFFYGRTVQGSVTYLGKVHAGNGSFNFYYTTATAEINQNVNFEILTCGGPATTTTLPPTTTTTLPPCGTFAPYDTVNGISALKNFGFPAGVYNHGTIIYIGYGNNQACANQVTCPAMLTDLPANPGGFFSCGVNVITFKATGNYYLLNHPNLRWVKTDITAMKTLSTALFVSYGTDKFLFGRYVSPTNDTFIGKAFTGSPATLSYINVTYEGSLTTGFEVVTCV